MVPHHLALPPAHVAEVSHISHHHSRHRKKVRGGGNGTPLLPRMVCRALVLGCMQLLSQQERNASFSMAVCSNAHFPVSSSTMMKETAHIHVFRFFSRSSQRRAIKIIKESKSSKNKDNFGVETCEVTRHELPDKRSELRIGSVTFGGCFATTFLGTSLYLEGLDILLICVWESSGGDGVAITGLLMHVATHVFSTGGFPRTTRTCIVHVRTGPEQHLAWNDGLNDCKHCLRMFAWYGRAW